MKKEHGINYYLWLQGTPKWLLNQVEKCPECNGLFRNLKLHIFSKHKHLIPAPIPRKGDTICYECLAQGKSRQQSLYKNVNWQHLQATHNYTGTPKEVIQKYLKKYPKAQLVGNSRRKEIGLDRKRKNLGDENASRRPEEIEKARIRNTGDKNPFYGKKHNQTTIQKMKITNAKPEVKAKKIIGVLSSSKTIKIYKGFLSYSNDENIIIDKLLLKFKSDDLIINGLPRLNSENIKAHTKGDSLPLKLEIIKHFTNSPYKKHLGDFLIQGKIIWEHHPPRYDTPLEYYLRRRMRLFEMNVKLPLIITTNLSFIEEALSFIIDNLDKNPRDRIFMKEI